VSFAESKEVCSPEVPSSVFRALLYWRLLCLSSCFVDPYPDSGRVGRRYEDLGRLGRGFRAPAFILPLAALPPSSWSAAFALLQRRVGSRRASHPSPPPSPHQSTNLPASKRALKELQRKLTTPNGQDVRFGSPAGASLPPSRPDALTITALSVGMREGEYGGGLRKDTLGKTTLRAEKEGCRAPLHPGDGIPQGRVRRPRTALRRGEEPIPLRRRSVRLLPRAR
jgi:hypothetical protein